MMNTPLITMLLSNWKRASSYVAYSSQISCTWLSRTIVHRFQLTIHQRRRNSRDSLHFKVRKTITRKKEQNCTSIITIVWNECKACRLLHLQYRQISRVLFSRFMLAGCCSNTSAAASDAGAIYTNGLFVIIWAINRSQWSEFNREVVINPNGVGEQTSENQE